MSTRRRIPAPSVEHVHFSYISDEYDGVNACAGNRSGGQPGSRQSQTIGDRTDDFEKITCPRCRARVLGEITL
jgi:hypothetical protein